jgi:hypothetical protein|tara:strand:+ start:617 stop:1051 length:435 start_codon:yes stop_codon:yes gene_type:complete
MVDAGLRAARRDRSPFFRWYTNPTTTTIEGYELHSGNADEIGRMLWAENVKSVCARYPSDTRDTLPGPVGAADEVEGYTFKRPRYDMDAMPLVKAIHGYEYQTDTHGEWRDPANVARAFCDALVHRLVSGHHEYEQAGTWEISG